MSRTRSIAFLVFLVQLALFASSAPARADVRIAVLVGNNVGHPGEEPLRFAEQDARRMRDLLVELGRVERGRAYLVQGQGRDRLRAVLDEVRGRAQGLSRQQPVTIIFYFAGHGSADSLHLGRTTVERAELLRWLAAMPVAFRIVLVDTCRTQASRTRGIRRGEGFDVYVDDQPTARGLVVMTSTSEGEPAQESDLLGGAVFTHYLVSALRGAADADQDGRVTLSEAYAHAYRRTVRASAGGAPAVQHPAFSFELEGTGDLVLTEPVHARAAVLLPQGRDQQYLVYLLPAGTVLAEVGASATRSVRVAVPPGRLLVQRREGSRYGVVEVEVQRGRTREIDPGEFTSVPYEEVALRGGRFDLHPTSVALAGSARVVGLAGGAVWLFGPALSVAHRIDRLVVGANVAAELGRFDSAQASVQELDLGAEALVGTWIQAGQLSLRLEGGFRLDVIRQRLDYRHAAAFAELGQGTSETRWSTAPGGTLRLGVTFPLGRGLALTLWLHAQVQARRLASGTESEWGAVAGGGAALALAWSP